MVQTVRLILLLFLASLAFSQTAVFPAAVATDADLLVAKNRAQTTLVGALNSSATTFTLASDAFGANVAITMGSEIILILTKTGATVNTSIRGYDGTAAASHASGVLVSAFIAAWHHNQLAAEIKAIETSLGINLVNTSPTNPMPINRGGTNAQTQAAALSSILGASAIPLANGGTAATSASAARTSLAAPGLADANVFTSLNTYGSATGNASPGAINPYTAPTTLAVRTGTVASPNTAVTPGMVVQMVNAETANIAEALVVDCSSVAAARSGFSGGCIAVTNVIHDQTIARGGVASRNVAYADAPPAVSSVVSAVNVAGTVTVTTATAHYVATGEAVIIAGTSGMANLNTVFGSVTVTSPTVFSFACGGCGAGPAGTAGTVTIPGLYFGSWDSVWKVAGPQIRMVGHESDMNNQYGDSGASLAVQDATFNYAIYCSYHNCTTGVYIDSGDGGSGKYYHPLLFGANAVVATYPFIDTSANNNAYAADFAWIGNNQFLKAWDVAASARWKLIGLATTDDTQVSAPTGKSILLGPNSTSILAVDASGTVLTKSIQPRELWHDTYSAFTDQHYGRVVYDSGTNITGGGWAFQDVDDSAAFVSSLLTVSKTGWVQLNKGVAFATLPACAAGYAGAEAYITNSSTATWGATITGGGANKVKGFCNATNWTVAAK